MSKEDTIVNAKIDDEFERYKDANHYNYTDLELSIKKKAIRDAIRDYPNVPEIWIDWLYDVVEKGHSKEEIADIIDNNKWGGSPKERVMGGQIVGAVDVLDNEEETKPPLKELNSN
jgi:hypothetical protein